MKKVFKFVKGKKDERKESGGTAPSPSGDLVSPARTPEDEGFSGPDNSSSAYDVDFGGRDKTLTKLHKAAWQGNLEKLKSALKKVEVDAVDRRNRTALHLAVARGHPDIAWFLLGNNADASVADDEGRTPLLKAIECGHKDCTTLLLDRGADVDAADYRGNTGLHVAVDRSSLDTAAALLKKGADTEVSNNAGDYPLHVATRQENKELVDLLLAAGASVDVTDRENRTPLMLAAKTGNCVLVRAFVERGAQPTVVDSNGWTARDYAMLGGHDNASAVLKSFSGSVPKKPGGERPHSVSNEEAGARGDEAAEAGRKEAEAAARKFEKPSDERSEDEAAPGEKEKGEDLAESPDAEAMPPFCQPPRSWEMIQAGMIDEVRNGVEGKRRSITALGTLRSRRESFGEGPAASPQFTLSLNRRKGARTNDSFAKQRFSFNDERSLECRASREKSVRKDLESTESESASTPGTTATATATAGGERREDSESDWDSASEEKSRDSGGRREVRPGSAEADSGGGTSESGTLGRAGTLLGVEEVWVGGARRAFAPGDGGDGRDSEDASSEKEGGFPPPPSALELGVDMAKSIKCMKGTSVERPPGCEPLADGNLWKSVRGRRSLGCLEERDAGEAARGSDAIARGRPSSSQAGEEFLKCQKPADRFADVNKRIKKELECYDQALRELAQSAGARDESPPRNYRSLPSAKTGGGGGSGDCREPAFDASSRPPDAGPHSLPRFARRRDSESAGKREAEAPEEKPPGGKAAERTEKKTKRHMLLAMREVKHAVHLANTFESATDDQILSPLGRPEDGFDSGEEASPRGVSGSSGGGSPADENPFFGVGRQETVLERNGTRRKSSSSGTGEESTLWLQDDAAAPPRKGPRSPDSDEDVPDIAADDGPKHRRSSSFSPLGLIQREMEEESRTSGSAGADRGPDFRQAAAEEALGGESEERPQEESAREQSPDVSLSSGPIEAAIGADEDSGSDPESSRNDASPALKSQREWLKCHLKAATSEKNKLEELSAQLAEKAERLQYELADAKEAAKSRDEVIRLLQSQLARMEAAYTKSLEESVQSRLQLTSHEQEILHLKELCFRYEEEKEAAGAGVGGDVQQELEARINTLEREKEKMREEIAHLEEEKSLLEKRLKQEKSEASEMIDECQRWKERCRRMEELAKARDSMEPAEDREHSLRRLQLEKRLVELDEENGALGARIQSLTAELEVERKKARAVAEKDEFISQMKRKNLEMEIRVKKLEEETEEALVRKLKEKEKEVEGLVRQFDRERDALVASYERKLTEGRSERSRPDEEERKTGSRRLRHVVESLRDQMALDRMRMSASVEDARAALKKEVRRLEDELNSVSRSIADARRRPREPKELGGESEGEGEGEGGGEEGPRGEAPDPKARADSPRTLPDGGRRPPTGDGKRKTSDGKRRSIGKEDEMAWDSLYGMTSAGRRRGGRPVAQAPTEGAGEDAGESKRWKPSGEDASDRSNAFPALEDEGSRKLQKLEFLELKKEILALQSKMTDEKNLRHALENQMMKMNLDLTEKDNLEKEVNSLKRIVDGDRLRRSEMELLQFQRDLEAKREKYLGRPEAEAADDDYKAKCRAWAEERERSKEAGRPSGGRADGFDRPPADATPRLKFNSRPRTFPEPFLRPRPLALDPGTKNRLERELDKSIEKYAGGDGGRPPP